MANIKFLFYKDNTYLNLWVSDGGTAVRIANFQKWEIKVKVDGKYVGDIIVD